MAGGIGDMSSLLKQAQMMQKRMKEAESGLRERIVEGSSGGGVVRVYVDGMQDIQGVKIAAEAVDPDDVEGLEDLVMTAVRQAMQASRELREKEMSSVTGGMNLPGMGF
ncbi:MAG: YbaB/EbfC family nucleoid-associated protein [Planctomycetes bacterium]|nr:YbaB/EbfC family nucleoid-associated protein [Planctomycetota bacterium]